MHGSNWATPAEHGGGDPGAQEGGSKGRKDWNGPYMGLRGPADQGQRCWNPYIPPAGSQYHLHPCSAHPGRASALGPCQSAHRGPDKVWPVAAASVSPTGSVPVKVQSKGELKGAGAGGGGEAHLSTPQRRKLHQRERPHSKTEAELQEETHPHPPRGEEDCFFSPAKGKCRHWGQG